MIHLRWPPRRLSTVAMLATFSLSLGACQWPWASETDPDEGGVYHNTTTRDVFIYLDSDSGLSRLEGAPPDAMQTLNGPCQSGPLVAKHTDSGPVIDAWEGKFCFGDYWTIPSGGLIKNAANDPIAVRSGSTTHTVVIGPGGTGSLEAPCADPPIIVETDADEELVPPRLEPLCVGDVWVIEEP